MPAETKQPAPVVPSDDAPARAGDLGRPEKDCGIRLVSRQSANRLTSRELAVAELATLSNRDIGLALGISISTVKTHFCNILRKTGLESRAGIAVMVERLSRKAA